MHVALAVVFAKPHIIIGEVVDHDMHTVVHSISMPGHHSTNLFQEACARHAVELDHLFHC